MNKAIKLVTIVFVTVMTIVGFAACCRADHSTPAPPEDVYTASLDINYSPEEKDDNLEVLNMTISYYDENGKEVSELITSHSFKKTIYYKKLPCKIGYKISYSPKGNIIEDKEYNISLIKGFGTFSIYKNGISMKNYPNPGYGYDLSPIKGRDIINQSTAIKPYTAYYIVDEKGEFIDESL